MSKMQVPFFPNPTIVTIPDLIMPNLRVLFVGINPSIRTVEVQHHFAGQRNRFYQTLHKSGFSPHLVEASNDRELLSLGLGITNFVDRATRKAEEVPDEELQAGFPTLLSKVQGKSVWTFGDTTMSVKLKYSSRALLQFYA